MIKVNLLRNRIQDPNADTTFQALTVDSSGNRDNIVKIACLLVFVVSIFVYESQSLRTLDNQRNIVQVQVNELEAKAQEKLAELESVKDIAKEAEELTAKLIVLKNLSRLRIREVKTMDFMQSSVPEKLWLKSISYESDPKVPDQGRYQFIGNAVTTPDLSEFVKRLDESHYLKGVVAVRDQEVEGPGRTGNIREFQVLAEVESKD